MVARKVFLSLSEAIEKKLIPIHPNTLDKNHRIFDVRFSLDDPINYGKKKYLDHRIPGAIIVDLDKELSAPLIRSDIGRHPLPKAEAFVEFSKKHELFAKGTKCICYDDLTGGIASSRLWWMLQNFGIDSYILDGGYQAYYLEPDEKGKYREVISGEKNSFVSLNMTAHASASCSDKKEWTHVVNLSEYDEIVKIGSVPLVDARTANRFSSTYRPYALDSLSGHPPGALNMPWNLNIEKVTAASPNDGSAQRFYNGSKSYHRLKPVSKIIPEFKKLLVSPNKTQLSDHSQSVFSCASGVTACFNIAVSTHIGLGTPKLYPGSWSEYQVHHRNELEQTALYANKTSKASVTFFMRPVTRVSEMVEAAPAVQQQKAQVIIGSKPWDGKAGLFDYFKGMVKFEDFNPSTNLIEESMKKVAELDVCRLVEAFEHSLNLAYVGEEYDLVVPTHDSSLPNNDRRYVVHVSISKKEVSKI